MRHSGHKVTAGAPIAPRATTQHLAWRAALLAGTALVLVLSTGPAPGQTVCTDQTLKQDGYAAPHGKFCTTTGSIDTAVAISSYNTDHAKIEVQNNGTIVVDPASTSAGSTVASLRLNALGMPEYPPYNTDGYQFAPIASVTNNGMVDLISSDTLGHSGAAILVSSTGASGIDTGTNDDPHSAPSNQFAGRNAGAVSATNSGTILVAAYGSTPQLGLGGIVTPALAGIAAYSIGGAGSSKNSSSGIGPGGNGGAVTVTTTQGSQIYLNNQNAAGILAQSAGGQGAGFRGEHHPSSGGDASAVTVNHSGAITGIAANQTGIFAVSVGGSGGAADSEYAGRGGNAGKVDVHVNFGSSIDMLGDGSIGVHAVSAGGLSWYAKNSDSQNGNGSDVSVTSSGKITTNGELAVGILAASTGGNSNTRQAPPVSLGSGNTVNAVPSTRAAPGKAGNVTVVNNGAISAQGDMAAGIVAVSAVGGTILGLLDGQNQNQIGQHPGTTGTVRVQNAGSIDTTGGAAFGILALSLGGPGGVIDTRPGPLNQLGGDSTIYDITTGNYAEVTNTGAITTKGAAATGILAQSIGGGGGTAGGAGGIFAVGGSGGGGGNGGIVLVTQTGGSIATTGDGAFGILAHSIGGGGGNGGNATGLLASVGGTGGYGGNGDHVTVTLKGPGFITTKGDFAPAVGVQSIGGGGGNGGYAKTYAPSFFSPAVGGSGGSGGNGGIVDVTNGQAITTSGHQSQGVLAHSIGGGGGNGGAAISRSTFAVLTFGIAVGGSGGNGGHGAQVTATNNGSIVTNGPDSTGMIAQSIGGGGGNGGAASAKSLAIFTDAEFPTISIDFAWGGKGGAAGRGGTVIVANTAQIQTSGDASIGILAQSIGGGGGGGGDSTAAATAIEGASTTAKIALGVGGSGGASGSGDTVKVTGGGGGGGGNSFIKTGGNHAAGIVAQSIGGGGGNGGAGNASTSSPNLGGKIGNAYSASFAIGGSGGASGSGGIVTVTNNVDATIATTGSGSQGILAQSIGGGGGNAGGGSAAGSGDTVNMNISVGGSARASGKGGDVTVRNDGIITTQRGDAVGIAAQSIGGGGGMGGTSDASASINAVAQGENKLNPPATSYIAQVSIGGSGGAGGDGGKVDVTNTGTIQTAGIRAYGILAQSIGGGGGSGGAATSSANAAPGGSNGSSNTYSGTLWVGGSGNAAGSGGDVTVKTGGTEIVTNGYGAHAILAQSIGGGGGIGAEGSVNSNTTITLGAGFNGRGAAGGSGGHVTVTNDGSVTTAGDDAYGMLAQSIGGGGGLGSATCTNSASAIGPTSATLCLGNTGISGSNWKDSSSLTLSVGGGPGVTGNGGVVDITHNGTILTTGARSFGIVAQSIGGGGGIAAGSAGNLALARVIGEFNNANGGDVKVTVGATGSITTWGDGAWGILAQSIGGGGGFTGDSSLALEIPVSNQQVSHATPSGQAPSSGSVHIKTAGNIQTIGRNAHGIFAQAVGAGGGIQAQGHVVAGTSDSIYGSGGIPGGYGNTVTVEQTGGQISANGPGSIGIVAQSTGRDSYRAPINIIVGGYVGGGTGSGALGILVSGGGIGTAQSPANTITVNAGGTVSVVDGVGGTAIKANSGKTNVVNNGNIIGNIYLGYLPPASDRASDASTGGTITNGGTLNAGSMLDAALVTNTGRINAGGAGAIGTTTITGDYVQGAGGVLVVDINSAAAQRADRVHVAGTAQLAGLVVPNVTALLPGAATIFSAGSLTSTAQAQSSLAFTWALANQNGNLTLTPSANFRPGGVALTQNHGALADYLRTAWMGSDARLAQVFAALNQVQNAGTYTRTLAQYSPHATQSQVNALANLAPIMLGAAMSCPVFVGDGTLLGEDTCAWTKISGIWANQGATDTTSSYRASGAIYRIGAQKQVGDNWFVGGSLATGQSWSTMNNGGSGSGRSYDGSIAVKYVTGPWTVSGAVAAATGTFNTSRYAGPQTSGNLVQSDTKAHLVGGRLRGAYDFAFGDWYVRPYADLDLTYLYNPAFQEYGGNFGLAVRSSSKTSVMVSPMVEIGGRRNFEDGMVLRPYVAAGVNVNPNNSRTVQASFFGASVQSGTFDTTVDAPRLLGALDIGVQLYREGGFEVKAEYSLRAGDSYVGQSGSLRAGYHF